MDIAQALAQRLPRAMLSCDPADKIAYARDLWPRRLIQVRAGEVGVGQPLAIVWPENEDEVAQVLEFARERGLSIVPFGAGSGVCGGVSPNSQTIVLDLKKMARFQVHREAPLLEVGAGMLGITLEEELARQGYTTGHFPSSILCSTVGGWIATRAAGQCSGLYGKIEDMLVEARCVLGNGRILTLCRRTSGPDLSQLLAGSEGILGVVTSAKLRLCPVPEARAFASFAFADFRAGCAAVRELYQQGLRPAVTRLYDEIDSVFLRRGAVEPLDERDASDPTGDSRDQRSGRHLRGLLLRAALKAPRAVNEAVELVTGHGLFGCPLIVVFEGAAEEVREDVLRAERICKSLQGKPLGERPARAWLAHRYSISYRQSPLFRMGLFNDTMEVAASWARLPVMYREVRRALSEHVFVMAHLSHAYPDGCSIYFTFAGSGRDDQQATAIYDRAWAAALSACIVNGGTLSHHHGVGRSKAPRLGAELGLGIELVRRIKQACDPGAILNPGALLPERSVPEAAGPAEPVEESIDETSLLANFQGSTTLADAEQRLRQRGLTLGIADEDSRRSFAEWVALGLPGARDSWSDPVDHHLAGLSAESALGRLVLHPSPRRAVGPDLMALYRGTGERVGRVRWVTVRIHRTDAPRVRVLPFNYDRDPPLSEAEQSAWDSIVRQISS